MGQGPDSLDDSLDEPPKPRLRERLRVAIRSRNYSQRTEKTYWYWILWFIRFHGKRHPDGMGAEEVAAFLSWLAAERDVAAASQNQALHALLFLYKQVLGSLLYGAGLRQAERLTLRVKDVNFAYRQVIVRDGKGAKDRVTVLPENLVEPLQAQLGRVRMLHNADLAAGYGEVWLPHVAAFVRDAPDRARLRHSHGAGTARAFERQNDDGLHACHEQWGARRDESARPHQAIADVMTFPFRGHAIEAIGQRGLDRAIGLHPAAAME